jgi:DNA-binding beta-propeller fold protein YncE
MARLPVILHSLHRPRNAGALITTLLVLGIVAAGALAYFVSSGTATASASVGAINAPASVTAEQSGSDVKIAWDAATLSSGGAVQGYTVTRSDGATICGSPALDANDSCTDTGVPAGSYTYTVTAVFGGFSAAATSSVLTVLAPPAITAEPSDPSANAAPSFDFDAGGGSGYQCQLDGGAYAPCSSPDTLSGLANGTHTLSVEATEGNATGPAATYTWKVDTSAPSITAQPSNPSANSSPSFSFTDAESAYAVQCQLDSGGFTPCTSPQYYGGVADGSHTFEVEGIDANGATTQVASYTWMVSTAAPPTNQLSIAVPTVSSAYLSGGTLYYNGNSSGSFALTDAATDSASSPVSATFPDVATSGWTHSAETVTAGSGSAPTIGYTSSAFNWSAGASAPSGYSVSSTDALGGTGSTPLTFVDDTTAPSGGELAVDGTAATAGGSSSTALYSDFSISSRVDYGEAQTAAQSGLQSSVLTMQSESLSGGTCGAPGSGGPFSSPVTITGTTQPSGIVGGACYLYTLTGTDNVGNSASISTTVQLQNDLPGGAGTAIYDRSIGSGTLQQPTGVAVDSSGNVYVSDTGSGDVLTFDAAGNPTGQIGQGVLSCPTDVAVDSSGNVYASDPCSGDDVTEFDQYGSELATFGSGYFCTVSGVAVDSAGNVYGSDADCGETYGFDQNDNNFGAYANCGDYNNGHVAVDASGDVYAADACGPVVEFDQYGDYRGRIGSGVVDKAASVAIDGSGNIYVLDIDSNDVVEFDPSGNVVQTIGQGQLQCPNELAVDPVGDVYVVDPCQGSVLEFTQGGVTLPAPASLALSPKTSTVVWGNTATVTATVTDSGSHALAGIPVDFAVSGGDSTSGTVTTNQSGQATFSYTPAGAGTDTVNAYVDLNNDGTDDPGDPSDSATVTVFVDTTPPTNSLSLSAGSSAPADAYLSGSTLYYNGSSAGSFSLTDAVSDPVSSPVSATFPAIATAGWAHGAETVTSGSGSAPTIDYTSSAVSWTVNPGNPTGYAVSSKDRAGNSATTPPLIFVNDTTAPTGGALSVNGTPASGLGSASTTASTSASFAINSRTDYSEAQTATESGLASSTLTVQSESLAASSCGAPGSGGPFTTPTTVTGTTQPSGITAGYCYLYTLTGTDNVGNAASISTTVTVVPALTAVSGSPFSAGASDSASVAFSPGGGLLATANTYKSSVSVLSVGGGGALTAVSGSPFSDGSPVPYSVAFSPSGGLLATANFTSNSVSVYSVGGGGALTPVNGSPFSAGGGSLPVSVAFSPGGGLLAVANAGSNTVSVFSVGDGGALTAVSGSPFSAGGSHPSSVAFSPGGGLLATVNTFSNNVSVFSVGDGGALAAVNGSPFNSGGSSPESAAFSPGGGLLAVANDESNGVAVFSVGGAGALTAVGTFSVGGTSPVSVAFSPGGGLLATANQYRNNVSVFLVGGGGALTAVSGSPFSAGVYPSSLAFSPGGGLLAVANDGSGNVSVFKSNSGL